MSRDLDLVRLLLLRAEAASPEHPRRADAFHDDELGHSAERVAFHLSLLRDAGFISVNDWQGSTHLQRWSMGSPGHKEIVYRLTNAGFDYLDAVRDETVWNRTKLQLSQMATQVPLDVAKSVAVSVLLKMIGV